MNLSRGRDGVPEETGGLGLPCMRVRRHGMGSLPPPVAILPCFLWLLSRHQGFSSSLWGPSEACLPVVPACPQCRPPHHQQEQGGDVRCGYSMERVGAGAGQGRHARLAAPGGLRGCLQQAACAQAPSKPLSHCPSPPPAALPLRRRSTPPASLPAAMPLSKAAVGLAVVAAGAAACLGSSLAQAGLLKPSWAAAPAGNTFALARYEGWLQILFAHCAACMAVAGITRWARAGGSTAMLGTPCRRCPLRRLA